MLLLDASRLPASIIDELKHVFGNYPGEADVVLDVATSAGDRARCGSARTSASSRRRRCAPSWRASSAPPRCAAARAGLRRTATPAAPGRGTGLGVRGELRLGRCARCRPLAQRVRSAASSVGVGPLRVRARASRGSPAGPSKRGSDRNTAQPSSPSSPSPTSAWRSRLEPSGVLGVVEVQRAEAVEADLASHSSSDCGQALGACGCRSPRRSRWQESRHRPRRSSPPAASISAASSCEGAPERAAGARGVLEVQRAALALRQRLADDRAGALDRRRDLAGLGADPGAGRRARRRARRRRAATAISEVSVFVADVGSSEAALSR